MLFMAYPGSPHEMCVYVIISVVPTHPSTDQVNIGCIAMLNDGKFFFTEWTSRSSDKNCFPEKYWMLVTS